MNIQGVGEDGNTIEIQGVPEDLRIGETLQGVGQDGTKYKLEKIGREHAILSKIQGVGDDLRIDEIRDAKDDGDVYQFSSQYEDGKIYEIQGEFVRYKVFAGKPYFIPVPHPDPQITIADINTTHGVRDGNVFRFADGSFVEEISNIKHSPPTDPYQQALRVRRFWELRLALAVQEFTHHRNSLLAGVKARLRNNEPAPDVELIGRVMLLREKVAVINSKLQEVAADVELNIPDNLKRNAKVIERNNQDCADFADALKSIEV